MNVAIFNVRSRKPYLSSKLYFMSKLGETWFPHSKRLVFAFGFVEGDNGVENRIKRSLFLIVFQLLFCSRSSAASHKPSLSRVEILRWIPRSGNQSGCENSLSYAILELISTCYLLYKVSFLLEYQSGFSWFSYHAVYNKWFTSYSHIGPSYSFSTAVPKMTRLESWLDNQQTAWQAYRNTKGLACK